ncbi:transglycosylase SLT domain-containing protein [Pelomicrobium methylotrophicum]|uniref:transglycosylase SLT domain-containing protein n=1 Tax=Pelomicrobium methylotrophicum TaxID=2602750 RepID=UPI001969E5EB|nr:transglycosylase SLT domain-containing protein [Pelomicrobium methylotrophicum]
MRTRAIFALAIALPIAAWADVVPLEFCGRQTAALEGDAARLVRAGLAVPVNKRLLGYMDEAMAERKGQWACAPRTLIFESAARETGVHPAVLLAVAMTESGKKGAPWPWTLNVGGRGFFFRTREDAWRAAQWLIKEGITNFDIGMMQISWRHNGWRFQDAWEALQPSRNILVAASILRENFEATGSWAKAIMWYHNRASESRGRAYLKRFIAHFGDAAAEYGKLR